MSTAQKCERCREYNAAAVDFRNQAANAQSDLAALLARHNALVDAVKKDRKLALEESGEFETEAEWKAAYSLWVAARAEVDRLIANEGAADCKGEG